MKLQHLKVSRFRGIRELDWTPPSDFICLIGAGDACKSAILDAADLVLSPRWNPGFDDSDFFGGDTTQPILVEATVSALPIELISDKKWGRQTRGWGKDGLHDEPIEGDVEALTIRLTVGADLEPQWTVVNDRLDEPIRIRAQDRELLGVARLGAFVDSHLSWSRNSVLTRLTESSQGISSVLASAARAAKAVMAGGQVVTPKSLTDAASKAEELGESLAVPSQHGFTPNLDTAAIGVSAGALTLHDGDVPLRRAGLGTKRLLALAMQRQLSKAGGILLVDEVEHGLEPHRIKRLLRSLRSGRDHMTKGPFGGNDHVVMTTHSPTVLQELSVHELELVRRTNDGAVSVEPLPTILQSLLRRSPDSFLGRKVIVCEGKTEMGVTRALDDMWAGSGEPFALMGVNLAYGNGSEAPGIADSFKGLGYPTALLCDSDRDLSPSVDEMQKRGIEVIQWSGGLRIEQRIINDLPTAGVNELIQLAMSYTSEDNVATVLAEALGKARSDFGPSIEEWSKVANSQQTFRDALAKVADARKWFKSEGPGEAIGKIVVKYYEEIKDTDLRIKLEQVRNWTRKKI